MRLPTTRWCRNTPASSHCSRHRNFSLAALPEVITSWMDNAFVSASSVKELGPTSFQNRAPATGETLCHVQVATRKEVDRAVASSKVACEGDWSRLSSLERGNLLQELATRLESRQDDFCHWESLDTGVRLSEVRANHLPSAVHTLRYYASLCISGFPAVGKIMDTPHAGGHRDSFSYTRRDPLGVCVGIGPWNYPLVSIMWKMAPALACGNTLIYKPSECTPITAHLFASLSQDVLPPGVLQVLPGEAATAQALIEHADVAKVSLTGSIATGIRVAQQSAATLKRLTLELGGKSPLLVFADADLDSAVRVAMEGNFGNNGEVCSNCTRIYVQQSILEEFMTRLGERIGSVDIGPLMMPPRNPSGHYDRVMGYIERAKKDPAVKLKFGGKGSMHNDGYYVQPTVFQCESDDPEIVQEEVFGPVMTVLSFDDEEDAIARANATAFGLGAGLMTKDVMRAHRVAKQLVAGNVWVNNWNLSPVEMPFGPYKMSGYGQELGMESLDHYSRTKQIYMEMGEVVEKAN